MMMTLEEIRLAKINPDVAREAYQQAVQRLQDQMVIKGSFEQKAFTLLAGYITVTLAIFGVSGMLLATTNHVLGRLFVPLMLAGGCFVTGAVCLVWSLGGDNYGVLGSTPRMWLSPGTIDGDAASLPRMLAYLAHHHQARIDASVAANNRKADYLKYGVWAGLAGPIVILIGFLIAAWS